MHARGRRSGAWRLTDGLELCGCYWRNREAEVALPSLHLPSHRLPLASSQTNTCLFCTLCPHSCAPGKNFPVGCAVGLLIFSVFYLPPSPVAALSFNYTTFSTEGDKDIKIEGDGGPRAGCIDISANRASGIDGSVGRVSYKPPVQLWDAATGELHHNLLLQHQPEHESNKGDGMAFFLASYPSRLPENASGGGLGLTNKSYDNVSTGEGRFVAVEFDTFPNSEFDPTATYDHIGIDVNTIQSMKTKALKSFSLIGNMTAIVDYDSNSSILSVKLWINDTTTPYTLSSMVDLKTALPENVTIGFSAATGASVELHQLNSWYFNSRSSFEQKQSIEVASPPPPPPPPQPPSPQYSGVVAGVTVGAALFIVLIFTIVVILVRRRRNGRIKNSREAEDEHNVGSDGDDHDGEPIVEIEMGTGPRRFPYYELVQATKRFAAEEKLGQGGFGAVYRGYLKEQGLTVAIKRFAKDSSKQGRKDRLRHRNLVHLVGWCHGHDELLLVYELVPNRSLDIHLHGNGTFLTWPMRVKIVLGLGSALFYLHEEWGQCAVHRDIKPSNVMLDESFNAKLGDFGLARFIDHTVGMQTMTAVSRTPGYVDPECLITGRASAKSDVYSFGIVLLEVACGRRPMSLLDNQKNSVFRLVEWAWDLYGQGDVLMATDEQLNGDYDTTEMERVITVGLWCAHPDPSVRPSIKVAMAMLESSEELPMLPTKMPVPTYASPVASLDGLFTSPVGMSFSSATQSSTMSSGYTTHTSSSSGTSTSAGSKDSSSLLKHQY
uniref:non-specific serine/threonine protein kinase n=1 Tax=Oryza glumipatula TaxID=40148 RepID=A0A0E0AX42_9ORYZ